MHTFPSTSSDHDLNTEQFWDDTFEAISDLGTIDLHNWPSQFQLGQPYPGDPPSYQDAQAGSGMTPYATSSSGMLEDVTLPYTTSGQCYPNDQSDNEREHQHTPRQSYQWDTETELTEAFPELMPMQDVIRQEEDVAPQVKWISYAADERDSSGHHTATSHAAEKFVDPLDATYSDPPYGSSSSKPIKPPPERITPYWRYLEPKRLKTQMIKKYMEVSKFEYETARCRLRTRCDPSIEADLMSGNPELEQRAVRNLDFQLGIERVFSGTEKMRLRKILINELKMHPKTAITVLCYGIAALPEKMKEHFAKHAIVGDRMYLRIACILKERYSRQHNLEEKERQRKNVEQSLLTQPDHWEGK